MRSGTKACCEEEQRGEASSGIYTYKHSGAKGVKKSRTHVQLSFAGVIFLLAIVWQSLLWKIEEINGAVASSLQQQECLVRCQTTLPQRLLHAPQMPSPHHTIGAPLASNTNNLSQRCIKADTLK